MEFDLTKSIFLNKIINISILNKLTEKNKVKINSFFLHRCDNRKKVTPKNEKP